MAGKGATALIDASNLILGRMASSIAKRLLNGETLVILNAEKALISGNRRSIIKEAREFLKISSVGSPKYGPFHPRRPELIVRRAIRGMIPHDKPRGREAYKRLKVYIGVPEQYKGKPTQTIPEASSIKLKGSYISVRDLAEEIGWKPGGK